jgi:glycosyltransferase involved in cell wall biosynthesis
MDEYSFDPENLNPVKRKEGISAFMRVRNGARFLKRTIESHIDCFDEIVAVYNDCTDETPGILRALADKYPGRLSVHEYEPSVYPPGSEGHRNTPADSVHSLANYYNYALSKTTCRIATKLDDDHLAIRPNLKAAVGYIRERGLRNTALCFSGINLLESSAGDTGVFCNLPFSGNRDIFFFPVSRETCFYRNEANEVLHTPRFKRRYAGILYFHLKFLKENYGFDGKTLAENPDGRYARIRDFVRDESEIMPLEEFVSLDRRYYLHPESPDFLEFANPRKLRTIGLIDRTIPLFGLLSRLLPGDIYLARASRLRRDMKGITIPADL